MYEELVKALRSTAEVNSLSLYKRWLMKQAADAIEDLDNRLNLHRQGKISRWIPVTERLPEEYNRVLVYSKATRMGRGIDFINADGNWFSTQKVSHWMPLPQPPQADKDGAE